MTPTVLVQAAQKENSMTRISAVGTADSAVAGKTEKLRVQVFDLDLQGLSTLRKSDGDELAAKTCPGQYPDDTSHVLQSLKNAV